MAARKGDYRNLKLATGILLSFAGGVLVAIAGFVLTILYLFASRHLHAAGPLNMAIYLIAPGFGALVALIGTVICFRRWKNPNGENPDSSRPAGDASAEP